IVVGTGIYLAQTLGVEGFGVWVFATSLVAPLLMVVDGGTEAWGIREVSTHPERLRRSLIEIVALRMILAIGASIVLGLAIALARPAQQWALAWGAVSLLGLTLNTTWAHRGLESAAPAVTVLLQRLLGLGLILLFVRSPEHAARVTFWQGVSETLAAVVLLGLLAPKAGAGPHSALPRFQPFTVLREAWPLGLSRVIRMLPLTFTTILLEYTWSAAAVGAFGAALRIAVLIVIISSTFGMATFPTLARAATLGENSEARVTAAIFRLLAAVVAPVALGGIVLAGPFISLLLTDKFATAAAALQVLLAGFLLMSISDLARGVLQARHQQRRDLRRVIAASLAAAAAAAALTPAYGAVGAAAATLLGEAVVLGFAAHAVWGGGFIVILMRLIGYPVLAAVVMTAPVALLDGQPLAVRVLAGAAAYAATMWPRRRRLIADLRTLERPGRG
ncbi:MAG: oligosaccharide flippase family protein, partial [Phenylobacterium sp.]|uniref:oligosaccharide flippase family protein n=1 Tax=Phenylobacterium sp. TaxID=1871053 RepID=UPI0027350CD3